MRPAFESEKYGYNKRQVDEYIDRIRAENEQLTLNNDQLFLLWMTQLNKMPSAHGRAPGITPENESMRKVHTLLEKSGAENRQPIGSNRRLEEEFTMPPPSTDRTARKKSRIVGFIFYTLVAAIVLGAYFFTGDNSLAPPRPILGFAAMTVLTRSMQDEIPQESLIIIREVDPNAIQIGDDITFLVSDSVTVTHRVVDIFPNYADSGARGFQTQGVNNDRPDTDIVLAEAVLGRVIFHNLFLGRAVTIIRDFALLIAIFAVLLIALVTVIRMIFTKDPKANMASQA